jgi:dihydropteroate synthase
MYWQTSRYRIDLRTVKVMGIVNTTPDSFADGGQFFDAPAAQDQCRRLVDEGADLLDIGGESSRPGAVPVSLAEERRRVLPALEVALALGVPVSLDTTKPGLMAEALAMGVDIINDISAFDAPGALELIAAHPACGVCLMHMRGTPQTMQSQASYADVVAQVTSALGLRVDALRASGIAADRIVVDPGVGFGKSVEHNFELLRRQRELLSLGHPLLVGWSRKSSLGAVTGRVANQRQAGSVAAALAAAWLGASVVRVHDVAATVDALTVWRAAGLLATTSIL